MRYKITVFIAALVFTGAALMATRSSVRAQNNSNGNMQPGAIGNNLMRCDINDEGCFSQQTPSGTNDLTGTWLTKTTPPLDGPPGFQGIFTFAADSAWHAAMRGRRSPKAPCSVTASTSTTAAICKIASIHSMAG